MTWIFFFYYLHLFLYDYILMVLSITAAANWKLFAFYGKYIRNRPSKKCFLPSTSGELCSVRLCLFCMILPGAPICIVLGGSWSDLGCSVILECSAFLLPDFLLYSTLFIEDPFVLWISLLQCNSKIFQKGNVKMAWKITEIPDEAPGGGNGCLKVIGAIIVAIVILIVLANS